MLELLRIAPGIVHRAERRGFSGKILAAYAWGTRLVPVRRRLELDLDRVFVLFDVVPLAVCVPTFCNYLNQDLALRDFRDLHRTVVVGLQVQLGKLVLMKRSTRLVEPDVNACVSNGLAVRVRDLDLQPRRRRFAVLVFLVRVRGFIR